MVSQYSWMQYLWRATLILFGAYGVTLILFLHVVEHKPIWYHGYTCTFCLCVRLCFYVWLGLAYGVCVDYLL